MRNKKNYPSIIIKYSSYLELWESHKTEEKHEDVSVHLKWYRFIGNLVVQWVSSGPKVKNFFSSSTQLKFFLLINFKMPTIVGILKFMSRKNSILGLSLWSWKMLNFLTFLYFWLFKISCSSELSLKKVLLPRSLVSWANEMSSLIFSKKQWINIYECCLLRSLLGL